LKKGGHEKRGKPDSIDTCDLVENIIKKVTSRSPHFWEAGVIRLRVSGQLQEEQVISNSIEVITGL